MKYRKLGNSKLKVSVIAMGGWSIVGDFTWGPQEAEDSLAALKAAYDCGINFFDTAESYGDGYSEQLLGKALKNVRDKIVIATKVSPSNFAAPKLISSCERSLKNLQTDWIDLYQLHWPDPNFPLLQLLPTLEKLKESGKIRFYGVSNFGCRDLSEYPASHYNIISNQLAYNLLFRAIEYEILPFCRCHGISVLCYSPLMQGLLTGKFKDPDQVPATRARTRHFSPQRPYIRHQEPGYEKETFEAIASIAEIASNVHFPMAHLALAWLLAQEGISSVIVGARSREQIEQLVSASEIVLPEEIITALNQATEKLKEKIGPNADMWQTSSRIS